MSSLVIPMPLSETVTVRAAWSADTVILKSPRDTVTDWSLRDLYRSLSMASDALEIISLRKISLWV